MVAPGVVLNFSFLLLLRFVLHCISNAGFLFLVEFFLTFLGLTVFLLVFGKLSEHEEIDNFGPFGVSLNGSSEHEDFSGEEPEDHSDGLSASVVAGNDDVASRKRRVGVSKADDGNVHVGSLLDGLVIGGGIGNDDKSRLNESSILLNRKVTS
mgnify:CR=1 FL=1